MVFAEPPFGKTVHVVARFLLGPAGSGKTFRCLGEIRSVLSSAPEGLPFVLLAPKQSTYQLERELLATGSIQGYTRLHVLSFERLARMVFSMLGVPEPALLSEQGQLMVLRSVLSRRRDDLKLFRASARLTGFATQLAMLLDEFQRHEILPEHLKKAAEGVTNKALELKLRDVAVLYDDYLAWLAQNKLQDANVLVTAAASALGKHPGQEPLFQEVWVDGFADLSAQESSFIAAVGARTNKLNVTFCLRSVPGGSGSWLSNWATPEKSFLRCKRVLVEAAQSEPDIEILNADVTSRRFSRSRPLAHIEAHWAAPTPFDADASLSDSLRVLCCADPETEVREAAREILRHTRKGGRFREVAVLTRRLDVYFPFLKRIFDQFEIPCFTDRREDVSHHPLAELTRSALRTAVFDWTSEDWFSALKTGLAPASEEEIDRLENEALARGWEGAVWRHKIDVPGDPQTSKWLADLYGRLMPPFLELTTLLEKPKHGVTGAELAKGIRLFWKSLKVEQKLQKWAESRSDGQISGESHLTVWTQLNAWLDDVELAFSNQRLSAREWMPILEVGLGSLNVGVIPPALDQVLAGEIERSRNCEARLLIILGLNEKIFPAASAQSALLTEAERAMLGSLEIARSNTSRDQVARERHLAYLAFTRASERLVLSYSAHDSQGAILNPSPFIAQFKRLFPGLEIETVSGPAQWAQAEHPRELIPHAIGASAGYLPQPLKDLPSVAQALRELGGMGAANETGLSPDLARRLYGPVLTTSVSRMEQFAACPFRFFVNSGLDAKERVTFQLDSREKGSFQHEVLSEFHNALAAQNKRWRDITPAEARKLVAEITASKASDYRDGLLKNSEQTRLTALLIGEQLQDFIETMVEWMRSQYMFDPAASELAFGEDQGCPAWEIDLGGGCALRLRGRVDRVDLHRESDSTAYCVVIDYKSSEKKLEDISIENGLQLQLLSYLNVVIHWPEARKRLKVDTILPAGAFYVNLRGSYGRRDTREGAISDPAEARRLAYRHAGRFNATCLRFLDGRDAPAGDQFNYRRKGDGTLYGNCKEPLDPISFSTLLARAQDNLVQMGRRIYKGETAIAPYRKGKDVACDFCDYSAVCRSDPWTRIYRVLRKEED